jgi:class 3 adenylate cyclase/tetratricopeptide (TPR) repeat protein
MPGTVTLLFTDLVDSTELLARLGEDEMQAVRRRHFLLLNDEVATHHGEVVKSLGDGIMAAFDGAGDAVACAIAIQRAVARNQRRGTAPLAVRIGVSAGEPMEEDGDYHGIPVVEAARLCAAARGGQILISEVVRLLVGSRGEFGSSSIGALELKGLPAPVMTAEVTWEEPAGAGSLLPLPGQLSTRGQLAFAGRQGERALLASQWQAAEAGERRIVLIAGEPGIGKTRLAAELAAPVHAGGGLVLAGRCDEDVGVPYAPFGEALRPWVEHAPSDLLHAHVRRCGGDLSRLVPELARRVPDLPEPRAADSETERWRLFEATVSLLADASITVAPLVLVLDDLHWAGKPALLLLRHLVRSTESMALLVLATYRDTDLARAHPLSGMLADLRNAPGVERLALRGLDADGVGALVATAARTELGESGRTLAAAIARETEGNPFFVQEVLRHLGESGVVPRDAQGRWSLDVRVERLAIPEGIREVVGRRLSRLSETANQALAAAAVIGRDFDLAVLEALGGATGNALLDALDEARRARLLVEETNRSGRYSFTHAMVRQTLLEELGTTRRVRLHLQIGEVIERIAAGHPELHLSALAHHFSEAAIAGGASRAVQYNRMAGDYALASAAWEEATAHYERAVSDLELDSTLDERARSERQCDLFIQIAWARLRYDAGARPYARRAGEIARRLRDPIRQARAADAGEWGDFTFGVPPDTSVLDEALAMLGASDDALRARLLARKVRCLQTSGAGTDTTTLAKEALAVARRSGDTSAIGAAYAVVCVSLVGTPDLDALIAAAQEIAALTFDIGAMLGSNAFPAIHLAPVALRSGDLQAFVTQREITRRRGEQFHISWMANEIAVWDISTALWQGRFDEAQQLAEAVDISAWDPRLIDLRAVERIETGRAREVIAGYESVTAMFPSFTYTRAVLAFLRADAGDLDGARREFEVLAANGFAMLPRDGARPAILHRVAETCVLLGDAERAGQLYEMLLPYSRQLLISYTTMTCLAAADRDLGMLAATMGRLDDAERHLVAAEQLEDGFGAPPLVARTRLALARMLLQRGGRGDADRVRTLLDLVVGAAAAMGMAGVERDARSLIR